MATCCISCSAADHSSIHPVPPIKLRQDNPTRALPQLIPHRFPPCPHLTASLNGQTELWPSGRRHTPAKGAGGEPSRGFESLRLRHQPLEIPALSVPTGNSPLFPHLRSVFLPRRRHQPPLISSFAPRVSTRHAPRSVCPRDKYRELTGNIRFLVPFWCFSTRNPRAFSVGYGRIPCSSGTGNLNRPIREINPAEQGENWEEQGRPESWIRRYRRAGPARPSPSGCNRE